jgi:hypothetical protein
LAAATKSLFYDIDLKSEEILVSGTLTEKRTEHRKREEKDSFALSSSPRKHLFKKKNIKITQEISPSILERNFRKFLHLENCYFLLSFVAMQAIVKNDY